MPEPRKFYFDQLSTDRVSAAVSAALAADVNGYDWAATGDLAYYQRPVGVSEDAWKLSLIDRAFAAGISGLYFGPSRSGPWTLESTAKAAAWQRRRRAGVPYIHRINCRTAPSRRPLAQRFCWVVDLEPGVGIHCRTFEHALETAQRLCAR